MIPKTTFSSTSRYVQTNDSSHYLQMFQVEDENQLCLQPHLCTLIGAKIVVSQSIL